MNIKQAESLSGVSRRNIRFYEQQGLLRPKRNSENDYRDYDGGDIETLKLIRALRMVDMPLEQIREIIEGKTELKDAASAQKVRLKQQVRKLKTAIRFCEEFGTAEAMDMDEVLRRMDAPENREGLFSQWVQDYRRFAKAQREKTFTFIPDTAITNAAEFTLALCQYGTENDLDLVITKEGMYPEFTIDGVEYTAERFYTVVQRIPTATVRCTAVHPEDFEQEIPEWKKFLLGMAHYGRIVVLFLIANLYILTNVGWGALLSTWEGWLVLLVLVALAGTGLYRFWLFHYNENGKGNHK